MLDTWFQWTKISAWATPPPFQDTTKLVEENKWASKIVQGLICKGVPLWVPSGLNPKQREYATIQAHNGVGNVKHNILKPLKNIQHESRPFHSISRDSTNATPIQLWNGNEPNNDNQNKEELSLQETLDWN